MSGKPISTGELIAITMDDLQPKLIQIFNALKTIWDGVNDPNTIRAYLFDVTGTTWPDFKLSGIFFNDGVIGSNERSRIEIIISGPYGSHLDSELIFITYDTVDEKIMYRANNFTLSSTLVRVALFIEEMVTYCSGLASFPVDTVTVLKV